MDKHDKTVIVLPKCGEEVILNSVVVDSDDDSLLNIDYDYTGDIDKETIDKEIGEIIIQALKNSITESEKSQESQE